MLIEVEYFRWKKEINSAVLKLTDNSDLRQVPQHIIHHRRTGAQQYHCNGCRTKSGGREKTDHSQNQQNTEIRSYDIQQPTMGSNKKMKLSWHIEESPNSKRSTTYYNCAESSQNHSTELQVKSECMVTTLNLISFHCVAEVIRKLISLE